MSKVWLVEAKDVGGDGVYIVRICATKEIAQQYIERFPDLYDNYLEPAEWEVVTECPERRTRSIIVLAPNGAVLQDYSLSCDYDMHFAYPLGDGRAAAQSTQGREDALQLARERLAANKGVKTDADN